MSNNIAGRVVVITGASSGLGEATARLLSAQGATVVVGVRRLDRIQSLAKELTAKGGKALAMRTDVTHREQVEALVDAAVETYGRIDGMINNAGLMSQPLLERLKVDDWERMIDVNIKGVLYGIAAALPYMKQQKAGHIINVSSVAGHKVAPGGTLYSATKHAVRVISEGLRQKSSRTTFGRRSSRRGRSQRTYQQHHRPRCPGENTQPLRHRRSRRLVRAGSRLRHEPARRR
jgi:NADP-dependent 3-hydroxy acid dehydrogenase YdfG